ncbi:C-C motif chemokine 19a.1 [Danio aesculapii]|uniref:C-C motif chemokine 19a.1 n=1 Tax=Danio aesculapii TaxID=1142201 RepID=UPI0024BF4B04|nr:C-C motif chemokine 19a.1 [Danio aesculapii]
MASSIMTAFSLAVLALLLCFHSSPTAAQADLALDCCLKVSQKVIPKHVLLRYKEQSRGDGCPRDAIIFITRRGLNLCAPPASEESWVKDTMTFLDKRREICKEMKFREKRCHALKDLKV